MNKAHTPEPATAPLAEALAPLLDVRQWIRNLPPLPGDGDVSTEALFGDCILIVQKQMELLAGWQNLWLHGWAAAMGSGRKTGAKI